MSESALQFLDLRRTVPTPAAEAVSWVKMAPAADRLCLVIDAPPGGEAPVIRWPTDLPAGSVLTGLWERVDFVSQFQPLLQRCLGGEEIHFELRFDLARFGPRQFELSLYPHHATGVQQAIVIVRDMTERLRPMSQLQLLLEIVHLLGSSPDLAAATQSILQTLCTVSHWPVGEVWLPTPDGAVELFSAVHRPEFAGGEQFHRDTTGLTLRVNNGPLAELWSSGPAFIADLNTDPVLFRAKAAHRAGLHSAFVIPLKHGEDTPALMLFLLESETSPDEHWMTLAAAVATELGAVFQRERMQEQLDTFFNRSQDLHCIAGFDGFLRRVNSAWTRLLGYETSELVSRPLVEFVHPDDRPTFLNNLAKLGKGEDLTALEIRFAARDGSERWMHWNATPLASQHLIISTGRDITRRKMTEAAVLQSEEHYRDLFHQAYQMQENLRKMSDRVLKLQEHERSRISRDLHDEVGQALTAINMNLAMLRTALGNVAPEQERRIVDMQQLAEQTIVNIQNYSRELRPAMLDELGLLPALRNYVKIFIERTGIAVQLDATQSECIEQLDAERKTVVYRIIQEGLTNVAKHANAKHVEIVIAGSLHDVRLQLGDDGKGFSLGSRPETAPKQLGLLSLAERTRLVGGEFAIASMPERGTILRATIPFKSV